MQPLDMFKRNQILLNVQLKFRTSPAMRPANKSKLNNGAFSKLSVGREINSCNVWHQGSISFLGLSETDAWVTMQLHNLEGKI